MINVIHELETVIADYKKCQSLNDSLNRYEYADDYNENVSYYESCIEYECEELKNFLSSLRESIEEKEAKLNDLRFSNHQPVFIYLRKEAM